MGRDARDALARRLDEDDDDANADANDGTMRKTARMMTDDEDGGDRLEDAASAQHAVDDLRRRLRVARQQFAEYCRARAEECSEMSSASLADAERALGEIRDGGEATAIDECERALQMHRAALRAAEEDAENTARAVDEELKKSEGISGIGRDAEMRDLDEGEGDEAEDKVERETTSDASASIPTTNMLDFGERAKYIPLRLTPEERKILRLLEAALHVSEYTDVVDVLSYKSKTGRVTKQLKEICAIMCGLVVASDYRAGQKLIVDKEFKDNEAFFQRVFEIGRRHKVMNPEKMRSEYGKLVYLLQDSQSMEVQELLDFRLVKPLNTVDAFLRERGGEALLRDALMETATAEIMHEGLARHEVQRMIKKKEKAREVIASRYASGTLSRDDILHCLYSISDNNAFLRFNRDPVDKMIAMMNEFFDPQVQEKGFSLGISLGMNGARLSHNHQRQFTYVSQTLMLWREIANDTFKLWYLAESDLLCERNRYGLTNTGQGLNRVQQAPRVGKAMYDILATCQRKLGGWVGSSVVHLGDHNVPNALMFLDKYSQVSRILSPIVLVIDELPRLAKDPGIKSYIDATFGSVESCQKCILCDFVRHGFDGSGADNFFDAGSCIDGRLTSAWNWCSRIEKKPFYHVFKLAGFTGFDGGDFRS
jgi:hypothetical protein